VLLNSASITAGGTSSYLATSSWLCGHFRYLHGLSPVYYTAKATGTNDTEQATAMIASSTICYIER